MDLLSTSSSTTSFELSEDDDAQLEGRDWFETNCSADNTPPPTFSIYGRSWIEN